MSRTNFEGAQEMTFTEEELVLIHSALLSLQARQIAAFGAADSDISVLIERMTAPEAAPEVAPEAPQEA